MSAFCEIQYNQTFRAVCTLQNELKVTNRIFSGVVYNIQKKDISIVNYMRSLTKRSLCIFRNKLKDRSTNFINKDNSFRVYRVQGPFLDKQDLKCDTI